MKKLLGIILCLFLVQSVFSHYKAKFHVIVDTDGGTEDIRALCMLLASPAIEVIAITTSDGLLDSGTTAETITALLHRFGHEGIMVGSGGTEALNLILQSIALEEMPVDFLALGPLTNIASVFESRPSVVNNIRKIYWVSEGLSRGGFNYDLDPTAADMILGAGFSMDMISPAIKEIADQKTFHVALDTIHSRYADALREEHADLVVKEDCLPLYLLYPEFFMVTDSTGDPQRRQISVSGTPDFLPVIIDVIDSEKEDKSIIFSQFPVDANLFEEDVAGLSRHIISEYGLREWKIVVLTNEFHEHLGIYSIIGAKMGLRAREFYNIGIDELIIESLAGSNPPVSCLNDGLQVSTGATLGHGTIVVGDGDPVPAARFTFKNSTIEIRLRENLRNQIREDVKKGVQQYGLNTPEYWNFIRSLALQYWSRLDRSEIFEITKVL